MKKTINEIKEYGLKYGLQLLSTEYKNNKEKLIWQCNKHGNVFLSFNSLTRHKRCPKCGLEQKAISNMYTYDFVKEYIEENGYTLLNTKYNGANEKLTIQCSVHGTFTKKFVDFKRGQHCPTCGNNRAGFKQRKSIVEIRKAINEKGYELIACDYQGQFSTITLRCPVHGIFKNTWKRINRGSKCPECSKYYRVPLWKVDEVIESKGYKRIGEFTKSNSLLLLKCSKHGEFITSYDRLQRGCGCAKCGHMKTDIDHSTTDVLKRLRALIKPWRENELQKAKYTCQVTGVSSDRLHVHHMTRFVDIVDITLDMLNYPLLDQVKDYGEDRWNKLVELFIKNNETMSNPVVMLPDIHKRFHMFCGGTDKTCSQKQLEDFKDIISKEMGGEIDGERKSC